LITRRGPHHALGNVKTCFRALRAGQVQAEPVQQRQRGQRRRLGQLHQQALLQVVAGVEPAATQGPVLVGRRLAQALKGGDGRGVPAPGQSMDPLSDEHAGLL
jgi:hypothetical protein